MTDDEAAGVLLQLTIELPPLPKGRPRTSPAIYAVIGGRRVKTQAAHTYTPAATRAYENKVAWLFRKAGARPATGALGVEIVFHTTRRGDIDNLLKACLDAGNGVLYSDDSQVEIVYLRMEADTPARTDFTLFRRPQ